MSEDFTREQLEKMADARFPSNWQRISAYALTLLDKVERDEAAIALSSKANGILAVQLTAARRVVEDSREGCLKNDAARDGGDCDCKLCEIRERSIHEYDKVAGK